MHAKYIHSIYLAPVVVASGATDGHQKIFLLLKNPNDPSNKNKTLTIEGDHHVLSSNLHSQVLVYIPRKNKMQASILRQKKASKSTSFAIELHRSNDIYEYVKHASILTYLLS
jgi:hypothetical protein